MRIFASWSGEESRQIALIFKEWIPNVIQDAEVYVSAQDISKGDRWLSNVNTNLHDHNFGISIITAKNFLSPWILYEAGALAKSLDGRLVPVLCGITTIQMPNHPLSQFQWAVAPSKDEIAKLMGSINASKEVPLPEDRLQLAVDMWHPRLEAAYSLVDLADQEQGPEHIGGDASITAALLDLMKEVRDIKSALHAPERSAGASGEHSGGLLSLGRSSNLSRLYAPPSVIKTELSPVVEALLKWSEDKAKEDNTLDS